MENFMRGAIVIEVGLLSFLLALWMAWIGLRGMFRLMLLSSRPATSRIGQPFRFTVNARPALPQLMPMFRPPVSRRGT